MEPGCVGKGSLGTFGRWWSGLALLVWSEELKSSLQEALEGKLGLRGAGGGKSVPRWGKDMVDICFGVEEVASRWT